MRKFLCSILLLFLAASVAMRAASVPDKLYMYGDVSSSGWSELAVNSSPVDGKFSYNLKVSKGTGYITFCTGTIDVSSTWTIEAGCTRYGCGGSSNVAAASGNSYGMYSGNDKCWTVSTGEYDVEVDFNTNTPTVTFTRQQGGSGGDDGNDFVVPDEMYLHGTFTNKSWEFNTEMTKEDKSFTVTKEIAKDDEIFITLTTKESNGAWNFGSGYVRYGHPNNETEISSGVAEPFGVNENCFIIPSGGTWTITMTFTSQYGGNITFTKENVGDDDQIPATLYLSGAFTGDVWDFNKPMTKNGDVFTAEVEVTNTVHSQLFTTFTSGQITLNESGEWTSYGTRYGAASVETLVTSGESLNFKAGSSNAFQLPRSGKWEVSVSFTTPRSGQVTFTRTGDIEGIDDPEPDPGEKALYIAGDLNSGGWKDIVAVFPTDHKYQYVIAVEKATGFVTFCTTPLISNNWQTSGVRYGAGTSEIDVVSGTKYTMHPNNEQCWKLAEGVYDVVVDFSAGSESVTFTLQGTENPDDPDDPDDPYKYDPANGEKSSLSPTGTLPVVYIKTDDVMRNRNLQDKEYRAGVYWIDTKGLPGFEGKDVGSEDAPLDLTIKARGNFTRTGFAKKPYKLKLGSKQGLLGLTKSKHFALLNHADDDKGFLRNFVGFNLGARIGLPWTPKEQPVELVINGDYRGIYFLTESIRVGDGRVPITELEDNEEDNTICSGGYLVELDNYKDSGTIVISDNGPVWVTPDTPEEYSGIQKRFVKEQFEKMNQLVNAASDELWSYMDLDAAARYYVVMEIIHHWEAYHGSTYLYRDRGKDQKWTFSPLWDCGHAFDESYQGFYQQYFTAIGDNYYGNTWIKDLRRNGKFMDKVKESFSWFLNCCYGNLVEDMENYIASIKEASQQDHLRWKDAPLPDQYNDPYNGNYPTNPTAIKTNSASDIVNDLNDVKNALSYKVDWLKGQWNYRSDILTEPVGDTTPAAELPVFVSPDYNPRAKQITLYYKNNNMNEQSDVRIWAWTTDDNDENDNNLFSQDWNDRPALAIDKDDAGEYYAYYTLDIPSTEVDRKLHVIISFNEGNTPNSRITVINPVDGSLYRNFSTTAESGFVPHVKPYSETLPLLSVTTTDGVAIVDTENEITASFGLEPCNTSATTVNATGTIRGRGTTTWADYDKKPYKLKLDKKVSFGGMPVSKHWLLMPWAADSDLCMLRNIIGHELSRRIGLAWTPGEYPVELTINGEYLGIYFVVENIRPAAERVQVADISDYKGQTEVLENWNDWIIELDNTVSEEEADFTALDGKLRFVADEPSYTNKNVNEESRQAIKKRVQDLMEAIYDNGRWNDIERLLDVEEAARYYVVQELMDDPHAFHTGCFLTISSINDGPDAKFKLGPVWDFSHAFNSAKTGTKSDFIFNQTNEDENLADALDFTRTLYGRQEFRNAVVKEYCRFMGYPEPVLPESASPSHAPLKAAATETGTYTGINDYITSAAARYADAGDKEDAKWNNGITTTAINTAAAQAVSNLEDSKNYLDDQWKELVQTSVSDIVVDSENLPTEYYDVTGCRISDPIPGTVIIVKQGSRVTKRIAH